MKKTLRSSLMAASALAVVSGGALFLVGTPAQAATVSGELYVNGSPTLNFGSATDTLIGSSTGSNYTITFTASDAAPDVFGLTTFDLTTNGAPANTPFAFYVTATGLTGTAPGFNNLFQILKLAGAPSVTEETYYDPNNQAYGGTSINLDGGVSLASCTGALGTTCSVDSAGSPSAPYSLTEEFFGTTNTDISTGLFQGDITVSATPLPATLPLFIGGLGALWAFGRKKKPSSKSFAAA